MGLLRKERIQEVHTFKVTLYTCRGCPALGEMPEQEMLRHVRLLPAHQALIEAAKARKDIVTERVEKSGLSHLGSAVNKGLKWLDKDD